MKKLLFTALLLFSVASLILCGCAKAPAPAPAPAEEWPTQISIGSFMKGSASYPISVAVAKLVDKYTPSSAVVREYAGGAPGMEALIRGDIDIWGVVQDDFSSAYYGVGLWEGKPQDVNFIVGSSYHGALGFGVRAGEGIRTVKDLAGKRVMTKTFLPTTNKIIEQLLSYNGILDKVTHVEQAGTAQIASAVIDRKVDAWFWAIGAAYTLQIKEAVGIDFISLTPEEQQAAIRGLPGNIPWTAPPWILEMYDYPPDKVLTSIAYCHAFGCRSDMPDFVAHGIAAALYDDNHLDEVRGLSSDLTDTTIEMSIADFWAPFHPGAVKYYKERGVWTKEKEARQQELLSKPR